VENKEGIQHVADRTILNTSTYNLI